MVVVCNGLVSLVFNLRYSADLGTVVFNVNLLNFSGFGVKTSSTQRPRNGQSRRKMTINVPSACMCWIQFTR
jgi:hypothetical protein